MKKYLLLLLLVAPLIGHAAIPLPENLQGAASRFRFTRDITLDPITLPTQAKVVVEGEHPYGFAIYNKTRGRFESILERKEARRDTVSLSVVDHSPLRDPATHLLDHDFDTVTEFDLDVSRGRSFIEIAAEEPLTSSELTLSLDENVSLPYTVGIYVRDEDTGSIRTVLSPARTPGRNIRFPETTARTWRITFAHGQVLRLRELTLHDENMRLETESTDIFWLAQPEESYTLFLDATSYGSVPTGESVLLGDDDSAKTLLGRLSKAQDNQYFRESDQDRDGVIDIHDNCITVKNTDQKDLDENGRGDACEDHDRDGLMDAADNCPLEPNRGQRDDDGDGIGNACDDEENRITERSPWLPWAGLSLAAIIAIGIILQTIRMNTRKRG